jgi:tetratricopeptide (TPR) repeat protein
VGIIPAIASAFQERDDVRALVDAARSAGDGVVLTQVLSGGGGVGKTQLAAYYAHCAIKAGTDLVIWVHAAEPDAIVTTYADAAIRVQVPNANGTDAVADAKALLSWLAATDRSWLVVLDDVDPDTVASWWPGGHRGTGWVLATTRRRDARLSGGGRVVVPVDVYTAGQSTAYLTDRLNGAGRVQQLDEGEEPLARELGHLPLALSHAAAYMIDLQMGCGEYLDLFTDRRTHLAQLLPVEADAEAYGREVVVTLLLALDALATRYPDVPAGEVIRLISMLDPAGQPYAVWNCAVPTQALGVQLRTALSLLHRYALITFDRQAEPRAITIHTLTARAVREQVVPEMHTLTVRAATQMLLAAWPADDYTDRDLAHVLRANTTVLLEHGRDEVWLSDGQALIFRAGHSYLLAGNPVTAVRYLEAATRSSERILGRRHRDTLASEGNLARAYYEAGRTDEAVTLLSKVLSEQEALLGPDHIDVLAARSNLAVWTRQTGRTTEAITLQEQVLIDAERILGVDSPHLPKLRNNLVFAYADAGRTTEAIRTQEQLLADVVKRWGPEHPDTLTVKANLANFYCRADRMAMVSPAASSRTWEAIALLEDIVAVRQRSLGTDHTSTLSSKSLLAVAHWDVGHHARALRIAEEVLSDRLRILGPDHPDTTETKADVAQMYERLGRSAEAIALLEPIVRLAPEASIRNRDLLMSAKADLATAYAAVRRTDEAVTLAEELVRDRQEAFGLDHLQTLDAHATLAKVYHNAGRERDAIRVEELIASQVARIFGSDDGRTITARSNLAFSYGGAGRTMDAVRVGKVILADALRVLGPNHEVTLTIQDNLGHWYVELGNTANALRCFERAAAGRARALGVDHPLALASRVKHAVLLARANSANPAAIAQLRRLHDEMVPVFGRDHPDTQAITDLIRQLTRSARYDE